ncbi:MAG TPA: hypothetical protein VGD22_08140 [Sphingobacteriaceae bacterium]
MKKLAAILFITIHLFTNEVYQLIKLPVLFDHYEEHKILNPNISFLNYLTLHYVKDSSKDFDHERDMQLPFKMSDHFTAPVVPDFIPDFTASLHVGFRQIFLSKRCISDESSIRTDFLPGIWQPPRFVN